MNKTILFLPCNKNHVHLFFPISKLLKQKFNVMFLTEGSYKEEGAEEALLELGIDFKKFDDYKNHPKSILEKENVGIVIIGNDTDVISQWFVNTANKIGMPSVLVQDGVRFSYKAQNNFISKIFSIKDKKFNRKSMSLALRLAISKQYKKTTYGNGNCTQIHVWGVASEKYLGYNGVDKNKMVITGNTKLDETVLKRETYDKKTILYAPTDLVFSNVIKGEQMHELIDNLCSALSHIENVHLLIKPHPRENMNFYDDIPKKFDFPIEISKEEMTTLLEKSLIVITDLSTISLEALAQNKPVIIFLPNIGQIVKPDDFPFDIITRNCALLAQDKQSLQDQIKKILDGSFKVSESVSMIVKEYFGPLDGKATQRSADSIAALIS